MTSSHLARRILLHNVATVLLGSVSLGIAALFWATTVACSIGGVAALRSLLRDGKCHPLSWHDFGPIAWSCTALLVVAVAAGGFGLLGLFLVPDDDSPQRGGGFSGVRLVRPAGFGWIGFVGCLAPLWTYLGCLALSNRLSLRPERLRRTCAVYDYLKRRRTWTAYPKLESQRDAIRLLARLNLVRVSRRFGSLEVKAIDRYRGS